MKKKLIEVALPLEAINRESAREKSIRHGHPSTLHMWWSRKPLATCRAVLFASLVDDPSAHPEQFPTEGDQDRERQRLFRLIEQLVKWESSDNQTILKAAHDEIIKSSGGNPPAIYDPFCGGGSIPLEAQRLGLEARGSDLNPVAVLITKALIEIPPKFAGRPPVNPAAKKKLTAPGMWTGARGLADDIRYYGQWMRDRAFERIGHHYPNVAVPSANGSEESVPIAWIYCRTVKCPNPACGATMPLANKFSCSTKPDKRTWIQPLADSGTRTIRYSVCSGSEHPPEGTVNRNGARCLTCGTSVPFEYIRDEGVNSRLGSEAMAVVVEVARGRRYLPVGNGDCGIVPIGLAQAESAGWIPTTELPAHALGFRVQRYGLTRHRDLFTERQLYSMATFSSLIPLARDLALRDGATSQYADAITTYLALALDRVASFMTTMCTWSAAPKNELILNMFVRQAISMTWDFSEANPFSSSSGSLAEAFQWVAKVVDRLPASRPGFAATLDAKSVSLPKKALICTDPPYYDNIGYADLSDFFYVWLRQALVAAHPGLFDTILVPKSEELVANPHRPNGTKECFENGLAQAFERIRELQDSAYPFSVFYAFKQAESEGNDNDSEVAVASTGWETMLEGLIRAQFQVTGTWPVRSERAGRSRSIASNALASSIVLVCRPRPDTASITTRKEFLARLKKELPSAVRDLQKGNIAPVDLAQAAIGPGMAVFSLYKKVLETDGTPMRVRTALALINQGLDEVLSEQESEFDPDTRWALAWFEQHQFEEGLYGEAEVLATAKALSISHLAEAGILHSRAGKVRLLRREEFREDWDPSEIERLTVWEVTQHLIRRLDQKGEKETANLKAKIGGMAEIARDLAYRLYTLCERKGWAEEAGYYNSLVVAWPSMASEAFQLS